MHEFSAEAITFYAVVFLVGTASSLARSLRDSERGGCLRVVGLALSSGFISLGIIGYLLGRSAIGDSGGHWNRWYYVALAALIGGLGKEQDNLRLFMINRFQRALKAIATEDDSGKKT